MKITKYVITNDNFDIIPKYEYVQMNMLPI